MRPWRQTRGSAPIRIDVSPFLIREPITATDGSAGCNVTLGL